ncbi:unnamed protein product, partial [Closterium sp. Naga37s-1]
QGRWHGSMATRTPNPYAAIPPAISTRTGAWPHMRTHAPTPGWSLLHARSSLRHVRTLVFFFFPLPTPFVWILNPSETFGNIIIDYSYVECTSASIQALTAFTRAHPEYRADDIEQAIWKARGFLVDIQRDDGSWYGSWGVCFTYGTWFGISGLVAAGARYETSNAVRKAVRFLLDKQLPAGGWGESYLSSQDKKYVNLPGDRPHLMNTAWAMLALMEAEQHLRDPRPLHAAARVLVNGQMENGDFPQEDIIGVFNGNCMISYSAYRNIFPIWALGVTPERAADGGAAGGGSTTRGSLASRGTAGGESGTPKRAAVWGTAGRGRRATGRATIRGAARGDSSTPGRAAGSGTAGGDSNTPGRAAAWGRAGGDSSIPGRAADRGTTGGTSSTPGRAAGRGAARGDSNTPGRAVGRGAAGSARITPARASSRGAGGDDISTTGLTTARSSVGGDSSTPGHSSVGGAAGGGHCIPWRAADAGVAGRGHITSGCAAARVAAGGHYSTLRRAKGAAGGGSNTQGQAADEGAGAQQRGGLPGVIVGDYDMQQLEGQPGVAAADQVVQWQGGGCEQGTESPRQLVTFDTPMAAVEVAVASDEGHHELPPPLPRYPCDVCFHTFATRGAAASHMTVCRAAEAERRAYALGLIPSLAKDGTQERPTLREIQDGVWAVVSSWDWEAFFCVEVVGGKTVCRIPQRAQLGVLDALPADQTGDGSEGIDYGAFDGVLGGEMA